jgi:hypothetical protein
MARDGPLSVTDGSQLGSQDAQEPGRMSGRAPCRYRPSLKIPSEARLPAFPIPGRLGRGLRLMLAVHPPQEVGSGWNRPVNGYLVKVTEQDRAETPLGFLRCLAGRGLLPGFIVAHGPSFPAPAALAMSDTPGRTGLARFTRRFTCGQGLR